jgi:DNA modification methylase
LTADKSLPTEGRNGIRPRSWRGSSFTDERDLIVRPNTGRKPRTSVPRGGFDGKTNELEGREAFRAITETRNKRSVWEVTTKPFAEAHFATFPPDLIEPCIKAGSREGDTVLDPFNGAGTTGLVATRLNRNYVGIELNPEYVEMSKRRIVNDAPLFNSVAIP